MKTSEVERIFANENAPATYKFTQDIAEQQALVDAKYAKSASVRISGGNGSLFIELSILNIIQNNKNETALNVDRSREELDEILAEVQQLYPEIKTVEEALAS